MRERNLPELEWDGLNILFVIQYIRCFKIFWGSTNVLFYISLNLSWRRPLSYWNQSIDLHRKSMDWFLYDNSLGHERVKMGKKWRKMLSPTYSLKFKNIDLFLNWGLFFFQMVISATLFRRCPTLWKSALKMTTLFRRCLTLFSSTLKNTALFQRCSTL